MNMNKKPNKSNNKRLTTEQTQKFINKYNKEVIDLVKNRFKTNITEDMNKIKDLIDNHHHIQKYGYPKTKSNKEKEVADEK